MNALPGAMLFDMDDTVVDTYRASIGAWRAVAARLERERGLDREAAFATFQEADRWFWREPERQNWGRLDQVRARTCIARRGLRRLGAADDGASCRIGPFVVAERARLLQPFPGALETLAELRRRGVALGMVTNGERACQRAKIEQVGLAPRFDVVVVEGEFGVGKPAPAVFAHALESIGGTADDAWMVGDDLAKDIAGGRALGMYTVWVDSRRRGLPADTAVRPDRIVHAIAELIDGQPPGRDRHRIPPSRSGRHAG